jgi:tetratricopeptide repeat protein 8
MLNLLDLHRSNHRELFVLRSASGRFVRLGTASMLSEPDGPFINPSQLNLAKYADRPGLNKVLFDYLFYHENDIKNSLELAALATQV